MTKPVTAVLAGVLLAGAQEAAPQDAVGSLLRAWDRHPLVAVAEAHRSVEDKEFLQTLIAHPEFPAKANDIVIEFGSARFQPVLDRYMEGQHVPREQLRRVWADTTVVNGIWEAPVYERFLAAVREVNQRQPESRKLRVLACDSPIDWTRVRTLDDAAPFLARDRFCASVLEREVLSKGRRALVVLGDMHIGRRHMTGPPMENAIALIESQHPGAAFVVLTYLGQYKDSPLIEQRLGEYPAPSLSVLGGTWLGSLPAIPPRPPTRTRVGGGQAVSETVAITTPPALEDVADALLYLGPKAGLTRSTPTPDQFTSGDLEELDRRHRLLFGLPLDREAIFR